MPYASDTWVLSCDRGAKYFTTLIKADAEPAAEHMQVAIVAQPTLQFTSGLEVGNHAELLNTACNSCVAIVALVWSLSCGQGQTGLARPAMWPSASCSKTQVSKGSTVTKKHKVCND